jgi:hypothetical protein
MSAAAAGPTPILPTSATTHQSYNAMPQINTPLVNPDLTINLPWYRTLVNMFAFLGKGFSQPPLAAYLQEDQDTGVIDVYESATGNFIGQLGFTMKPGPVVQVPIPTNPFVYMATTAGTLAVQLPTGGTISLSRDSGVTFFAVGTATMPVPVRAGDRVEIAFTAGSLPLAYFFPNAAM